MRKIKSRHSEKILLKGLGFTFSKGLRLMLFSMTFAAIGLCAFVFAARLSFDSSVKELTGRLNHDLEGIASLNDTDRMTDSVLGTSNLHFKSPEYIGAKDMDVNKKTPLTHVKGQRRFISANQYEIRFVKADD